MTTSALDLADIQGDILRAYGNRYSRTSYLFIGVADADKGRTWLGDRMTASPRQCRGTTAGRSRRSTWH